MRRPVSFSRFVEFAVSASNFGSANVFIIRAYLLIIRIVLIRIIVSIESNLGQMHVHQ